MKRLSNNGMLQIKSAQLYLIFIFVAIFFQSGILSAQHKIDSTVFIGSDGHLKYKADKAGNRVPDFSYSGYQAGGKLFQDVPVKVTVPVSSGDATRRIQAALDYVSGLPLDKNGFRGTVLLDKGTYSVLGRLRIVTSGVVLRGLGTGTDGTTLVASGTDRTSLISVKGDKNKKLHPEIKIINDYVPVNALKLRILTPDSLKKDNKIIVRRPSTKEWIETLNMQKFGFDYPLQPIGWKPGQHDLFWDRTIVSVNGDTITLDAPITTALEQKYGGAFIAKYEWLGRIENIGIENMRLISEFDKENPKDDDHCWMAINIENTCDAWVRNIVFEHFAGSAVAVWETAKRITVEDCRSINPVSEIGGQRRYSYWISGQQVLVQRCYAENGYHDFATGFCTAGPNAFVNCEARVPFSFSGTIDSWASGILFDNVSIDGNALSLKDRGSEAFGAGWTSANCVLWQCKASRIFCYNPPTAQNWTFGLWGTFDGNGTWIYTDSVIKPNSLYYAQLTDRLGKISQVQQNQANTSLSGNVKTIDQIGLPHLPEKKAVEKTSVKNGWLVHGNTLMTGLRLREIIWSASTRPDAIKNAPVHLTRFVPGRTGTGYTDDIGEIANMMTSNNIACMEANPGLWYERRRDSHEWFRQMDGDVWPPFLETPFARSGQGYAWDGLSKYNLLKYSNFYWSRLKQFADLADQKGLILVNQNYLQHSILENGVHWSDFPWRTVNNINNTGFPEPPTFTFRKDGGAPNNINYPTELFYDTTNIFLYKIHKAYITQCLKNFEENSAVIQMICDEYTGPYNFVRFWLNTIKEWEQKTGKHSLIGLSVTKDVQDSILAVPALRAVVDIIDIRYWSYRDDGSLYAPKGGQNLAPRQQAALLGTGKRSFEQTWRAVSEYRQKFPYKAVIYSGDGKETFGWAVFMAGGSLASIPKINDRTFYEDVLYMHPLNLQSCPKGQWVLGSPDKGYIIYIDGSNPGMVNLSADKQKYVVYRINPLTGDVIKDKGKISGGKVIKFESDDRKALIFWLKRIQEY